MKRWPGSVSLVWAILILMGGCVSSPPLKNTVTDAQALHENFAHIVFTDEYDLERKYQRLVKWTGPINIALFGDKSEDIRPTVTGYSAALSSLTGLTINVIGDGYQEHNFNIYFVPWDDMVAIAKPFSPNPDWLDVIIEDSSCLFVYQHNTRYEIKRALVLISTDESTEAIKSCLLEEMTQALGLPNDSERIKPSIFNQWDNLQYLTTNDKILIRTLYDPRLKPGMPKESVLRYSREIINQLVNNE